MTETTTEEVFNNAGNKFTPGDPGKHSKKKSSGRVNIPKYLDHYGISYKIKQNGIGMLHCLEHCLFDSAHVNNEASIIQQTTGMLLYQCFHNSCKGRTWKDARSIISGDDSLVQFMEGDDPTAVGPDAEADPESLYEKLLSQINESDNVTFLVNDIAPEVRKSEISKTLKHALLKSIAKKSGGTVKTIYQDTRQEGESNDAGIDHLQTATEVIQQIGAENLVFISTLRLFRRWTGSSWAIIDDREISEKIIAILSGSTEITKNLIDSISDLIRTLAYLASIGWDEDRGVIPVKNGELSYRDGRWKLSPHVREHYRTTLIPAEYDPKATAPRFEQFLDEVFLGEPDATDKAILICEMIGYTLVTSCEYEKFILLIGPGANGKSVLLDVLRLLIGSGQVAAVQPEQMDNRFQRAHLHGKLANIVTEIREGGEIADAALKAISSGELMTAEHKFKPPFDFQPFSTCWFGTNHMPHTRDFSDALFRRALIVEFNRTFSEDEQDKHLKKKLAAELPGIMLLALTAFGGVIERGCFTIPESCVRAKNQWRLEADQVAQFLQYCCVMEPNAWVEVSLLYRSYKKWADENGIKRVLNQINFSKRIQRLGGKPSRTNSSRGYDGIRLIISTQ